MKRPEDLLGSENYFHWEFNMRMTLARKGLLDHIMIVKHEHEWTEDWRVKDMKAFAIIAQGIEVEHQSKIRQAVTAKQAWDVLRDYYNRSNLQNRVALTRKLHEFKMEEGCSMSNHLDRFGELVVAMEAVGDALDSSRQLVILLGSLPPEYDTIVTVIENTKEIELNEVKEKLLKQHEKLQQQDTTEGAFKARFRPTKGKPALDRRPATDRRTMGKQQARPKSFHGTCFACNKRGHKEAQCPNKRHGDEMMFMASSSGGRDHWLVDSGASSHMSPYRDDFTEYHELSQDISVTIADGQAMKAIGRGCIKIKTNSGGVVTITDALHIPNLDRRLLSVPKLTERGLVTRFDAKWCTILKGDHAIVRAKREQNVYVLRVQHERAMLVEHNVTSSKWELWHARVGHASFEAYKNTQCATSGMPEIAKSGDCVCGGCAKGKMTVASFPSVSTTKTSRVLELIHTDVMGPMKTVSGGGSRYVLSFVDDFSKFVTVYFLKHKSQVTTKFIEYKAMMENQCGTSIQRVRSDNGKEYKNKRFAAACRASGIVHQTTVPYSPQQNGVAERMNRTIMERARCMLHYKAVPKKWWAEAVATAVYLINRTTTAATPDATPYELCFNDKPSLRHLRVFGSLGYAHIDDSKRKKLDAKSFRCMLLGYAENAKGYKVLNMESGKVVVSRSLEIDEREVDGIYDHGSPMQENILVRYEPARWDEDDGGDAVRGEETRHEASADIDMDEVAAEDLDNETRQPAHNRLTIARQVPVPVQAPVVGENRTINEPAPPSDVMVFRPAPNRRASDRYQAAIVPARKELTVLGPRRRETVDLTPALPQLDDRAHNPASDSIVVYDGDNDASGRNSSEPLPKRMRQDAAEDMHVEVALAANAVPRTYNEAMSCADRVKWAKAIADEFAAHERNKTWTKVIRRPGMKVIGTKWVFAEKRNEIGEVTRLKARLVALGFLQLLGVDFFETYAAVANMNSIRIFLSVCCAIGYVIEQLDVDTAYLNADLEEDVYIELPQGLEGDSEHVLKLNKALYGLKQAGNAWGKTIQKLLIELGFKSCGGDTCIFVKKMGHEFVYVCLYVDDMVVAARTPALVRDVKQAIASRFQIKDLGAVKHLLGMEIAYDQAGKSMTITQEQYIKSIAERFNQENARDTANPCDESMKLSKADAPQNEQEEDEMSKRPYRSLVGCLQYVAQCTRPDVAYAVTHLSRFMENPGPRHWAAAIRILRYLKTTANRGLNYSNTKLSQVPIVYCDADWGSNIDDRRSVSGVVVMMNGGPVVYKAKYQRTVALSSSEAEYLALSTCAQEVMWVRAMLRDLGFDQRNATQVWEDNQGAIALANNAGYHARTKHVDIRHHFIREKVAEKEIKLGYIATERQLADLFTKALGTKRFEYLRDGMRIVTRQQAMGQQ